MACDIAKTNPTLGCLHAGIMPRSQEEFCCTQSWAKPTWDIMFRGKPPHFERNTEKLKPDQLGRGLDGEGKEKPGPRPLVEGAGAVGPGEEVTRRRAHLLRRPPKGCHGTKKRDTVVRPQMAKLGCGGGMHQEAKFSHAKRITDGQGLLCKDRSDSSLAATL